jgi:hypothetical protein
MNKFWWKGEPLIVGSLRWRIIDNDLKNTIKDVLKQIKPTTNIEKAVSIAHNKGLRISFKLLPK